MPKITKKKHFKKSEIEIYIKTHIDAGEIDFNTLRGDLGLTVEDTTDNTIFEIAEKEGFEVDLTV